MLKIISGGQTGVDRAALDTAMAYGFPTGGFCSEGRQAEDGEIPEIYPLKTLPGTGYSQRTAQNVFSSDGTLIIYFSILSGGTQETLHFCKAHKKPVLLIDGHTVSEIDAAGKIHRFIQAYALNVLNIAGPRASEAPAAYTYTRSVLHHFFEKSE